MCTEDALVVAHLSYIRTLTVDGDLVESILRMLQGVFCVVSEGEGVREAGRMCKLIVSGGSGCA